MLYRMVQQDMVIQNRMAGSAAAREGSSCRLAESGAGAASLLLEPGPPAGLASPRSSAASLPGSTARRCDIFFLRC